MDPQWRVPPGGQGPIPRINGSQWLPLSDPESWIILWVTERSLYHCTSLPVIHFRSTMKLATVSQLLRETRGDEDS